MPEIKYNQLKEYLDKITDDPESNPFAPVYLIFGEELLCKNVFKDLLDVLLPAAERSLHYEPIAGDQEHIADTIEKINTYSLQPGKRVVAVIDSRIFYSPKDTRPIVEKAKAAFDRKDISKAAKHTLDLLGLSNLVYDEIDMDDLAKSLSLDTEGMEDFSWLIRVIEHCRDNHLSIPDRRDRADLLKQAIEKGFPRGNHLLVTTDVADKRRNLFKTIKNIGLVINCAVPKGDRRADRTVQDAVLAEQMNEILSRSKKKMAGDAYRSLIEMTGFDLRTFTNNLEKLISYLGERETITVSDVAAVLQRTKKDPIYELTNSIAERNVKAALFFLKSLLDDNVHPLQILAAISNQIRRLLIVKDFILSDHGKVWQQGLSFDQFKNHVMPAVQAYDRTVVGLFEGWRLEDSNGNGNKKERRKKIKTGLLLAKNPGNPYPVYLALQKSETYDKDELLNAIYHLNDADLRLKSSPQDPRLVLERVIFSICQNNADVTKRENHRC
ncbi:DNA polymerase III subunit delta [Thermodesulfobacteriota bacterium]